LNTPFRSRVLCRTPPLILLQAFTRGRDASAFSLVVPLLAPPSSWVSQIGGLIEKTRALRESCSQSGKIASLNEGASNHLSNIPRNSNTPAHCTNLFKASDPAQTDLKAVKSSQFLRALTPEMLGELETVTTISICNPGTVLFAEGQLPHEVFLLLDGQVKFFMNANDGRRLTVHIAGPGELLGLPSAFTSAPHKTSAETLYPSRIACIACSDFMKFLLIYPKASQAAARELSESCDRTYTRLRTIGVTPCNRAKLARLILEWATFGKQTERGIQIHMALKHGEIAECIGTCRESVTRILRDFQRWQVIELRGSLLTIADLNALEQCADLR
jgi:CRP/FNR family transcriptional regulator, cyclic AMP receptor protein